MKVVLQRVKSAYVKVDSSTVSEIDSGYLLLWGIEESDTEVESEILINKILNFRIFSDENFLLIFWLHFPCLVRILKTYL